MNNMESPTCISFSSLSKELICHMLSFLPLRQILLMGTLNKSFLAAVDLHLRLIKIIDFCDDEIIGYMPTNITDKDVSSLLKKCPNVEVVRGLHPLLIDRSRLRRSSTLSVAGVIEALSRCPNLKRIETSHFRILEAVSQHLPYIEIEGHFRNRNGVFPPLPNQQIKLSPFLKLRSLHLIGVQVPELTEMLELEHLCLQWVSFTRLHPFRMFSAYKLKTFVMKHCIGPTFPLRYYPLFIALGFATELSRLELVRVPILSGMILRSVEEALRNNGFKKIRKLVIADCKGVMESDLGQLMIASSQNLETLSVQASLTKDSLFVSLQFARCDFSKLKTLHLGYADNFPPKGEWSNDTLLSYGLADVPDVPSSITDSGLKIISELFPNVENLTISNCQHVVNTIEWRPYDNVNNFWPKLRSLILERCHCLRLHTAIIFFKFLDKLEVLVLKNMFPEPPKGCSHVGLSAGTGLGLSSAVVSTRDEHIAVQGHVEVNDEFDPHGFQNQNDMMEAANNIDGDEELEVPMDLVHNNSLLENFEDDHSDVSQESPDENAASINNINYPSCSRNVDNGDRCENCSPKSKCRYLTGRRSSSCKKVRKFRRARMCPFNPSNERVAANCCCKGASTSRQVCTCSPEIAGSSKETSKSSMDIEYLGPVTRHRSKKSSLGESPSSPQDCSRKGLASKKIACGKKGKYKSSPASSKKKFKQNAKDSFYNEEEVDQAFYITSNNLLSLTVISCGFSEINLSECVRLIHLEVQSCRILCDIYFSNCNSLSRINISDCRKLKLEDLIPNVIEIYTDNPILVYIEPYLNKTQEYYSSHIEDLILRHCYIHDNILLMHTYCLDKKTDITAQENLMSFMKSMKSIVNKNVLFPCGRGPKTLSCYTKAELEEDLIFPYGHTIGRLYDKTEWCEYEMLSNRPFFIELWKKYWKLSEDSSLMETDEDSNRYSCFASDLKKLIRNRNSVGKYYVGFLVNVNKK